MARSERTERMIVRRMYGVHLKSRVASAKLNSRLGLNADVVKRSYCDGLVMRRKRIVMIWFQHVDVLKLMEYKAGVGRLWDECVKDSHYETPPPNSIQSPLSMQT